METSVEDESDEALLEGYFTGNRQAFEKFFRRHVNKVTGYAASKGIPMQEAAEVAQEVFIKMHKSIDKYQVGRPALPWFFTIVKNTCTDWHRYKVAHQKGEVLVDVLPESFDANSIKESGRTDQTSAAYENLSVDQKMVLTMRFEQEKSFKEIALATNKTESALRKIYERALSSLKKDTLRSNNDKQDE